MAVGSVSVYTFRTPDQHTSATTMSQSSRCNLPVLVRRVYTRMTTNTSAMTATVQTGMRYVPALLEYGELAIASATKSKVESQGKGVN